MVVVIKLAIIDYQTVKYKYYYQHDVLYHVVYVRVDAEGKS